MTSINYMRTPTHCFCNNCHGAIIPLQTMSNHRRSQLKTQTLSEQAHRKHKGLAAADCTTGPSLLVSPMHLHLPLGISAQSTDTPGPSDTIDTPGSLAHASTLASGLDVLDNVIYDTTLGMLSNTDNVNPEYIHEVSPPLVYASVIRLVAEVDRRFEEVPALQVP